MKRICIVWNAAAALIVIISAAGCGHSMGPDADPSEAVTVLQTALETWKRGEQPESLQGHSPPIWFNEDDWKSGVKLIDYKLDNKTTMYGRQVRCLVNLTTEKNNRKSERKIAYLVDTTPNRVIAREGL
jgi:hypothetical protein